MTQRRPPLLAFMAQAFPVKGAVAQDAADPTRELLTLAFQALAPTPGFAAHFDPDLPDAVKIGPWLDLGQVRAMAAAHDALLAHLDPAAYAAQVQAEADDD